ncbi:MAG: hypothetical protein M1305_00995 [Candidatus Marsarchaeota archaeon]|jgi:hypothetical protein|nr:hypothetical protein [Candidatus Marsarchaeota archaeon]
MQSSISISYYPNYINVIGCVHALPIIQRLKKKGYREIASFHDAVVDLLYQTESSVILHGGTAVWRCYGGGRF